MAYARLDDRYDDHRKIKRAWRREPAAVALHAMAITYANRHATDGKVEVDWVEEKLALLPFREKQRQRVVDVLVELGLFDIADEDHYFIHDFLDWNRSRAQREALVEQGRRGGQAKAAARASRPDGDGSGPGSSQSLAEAKPSLGIGSSTPSPTPTPTPTLSQERNGNAELRSAVTDVFAYWQEKTGHQQAHPSDDRLSKIRARLVERRRFHDGDLDRAVRDCRRAVDGAAVGAFVDDRGKRHDGIELIFRNNEKLEDFMGRASLPVGGQVVPMRRADNADSLLRKIHGGDIA